MCSTDHFLAEIKVANSAPGGLPRHSSLHSTSTLLIGQQKTPKLRLLTQTRIQIYTLTDPVSVQATCCWTNIGFGRRSQADLGWSTRRHSVYLAACRFSLCIKPLQISRGVHHPIPALHRATCDVL